MKKITLTLIIALNVLAQSTFAAQCSQRESMELAISSGRLLKVHSLAMDIAGAKPLLEDYKRMKCVINEPCEELLISDGFIETIAHTAISQAVQDGSLSIVRYLIEVLGADINQKILVTKRFTRADVSVQLLPLSFEAKKYVTLLDIAKLNQRTDIYAYLVRKQSEKDAAVWVDEFHTKWNSKL